MGNFSGAITYYNKELAIRYNKDAVDNKNLALEALASKARAER
jgi:hypothetical protein